MALFGKSRVGTRQVLEFTEQLSTLLDAGLPLDRALHIISMATEHEGMRAVVQNLFIEVEKGHPLAEAFSRYPEVFPRLYVNMIRAGEEGGVLPVVLTRLVEFYERSIEFRSFLITSSIYPLVLFIFGTAAIIVLIVVVIPKFGELFADMHQTLPLAAAILIGLGDFMRKYGLIILGALIAIGFGLHRYTRAEPGQGQWHRLQLALPLLGKLILKVQLARVCRTVGTLLTGGVPILTAMRIAQGLSDSIPLSQAMDRLQRGIKEGKGVARPLLADSFFPRMLGQFAAIGEESGALDRMLNKVADQYENEIKKATRNLIALFEPVMIVTMGGLIGVIVVSMLAAIFSINDMPM